jgi:hypothetical protein
MRKKISAFISPFALILLGATLTLAQNGIAADRKSSGKSNKLTNEPVGVISFEKSVIDFGVVKRGQKLTATFQFKNVGQGPLTIQGVQAACDCVASESIKGKIYPPGESGTLDVNFDTKDYVGKITKAITVITNERSMPDRTLTITATINSEVNASPPLADFGDVVLNQSPTLVIKVKGNMKNELRIEKIRFNEEFLDVSYRKEAQEFAITIKLKANAPIGFFKDTIWIKNNSSALPDMPIPIRATIRGEISLNPAYVEFGSVSPSEKSLRQISLTSASKFDITSNRIEMNVNGAKSNAGADLIKVEVSQSAKNEKKVKLELKNPGNQPGSVHGKITLETSNPQQKNLTFDFYAFFR